MPEAIFSVEDRIGIGEGRQAGELKMHSERYYRGPARNCKLGLNKRGEVEVSSTSPRQQGNEPVDAQADSTLDL
jgi:hypothetical protein